MDVSRTIKCASFWEALVLRLMLEEHGVQVDHSDEDTALSIVASGTPDGIKAAVAQLSHEVPRAGPVVIEGDDRGEGVANVQPTTPDDPMMKEARKTDQPDPSLSLRGASHRPPGASNASPPPKPAMPAVHGAIPGQAERADVAPAQSANSRQATGALNSQETGRLDRSLNGEVVIVRGEVRYHRRSCTLIRLLGRDDLKTLPQQQAKADGCMPCRACAPDKPLSD
jgi:hypothetical protein